MSKWRRIAIEKMPSCKRLIEESESPGFMGIRLYEELDDACRKSPPDAERIRQIYDYFLPRLQPKYDDNGAPWHFFNRFVFDVAIQTALHKYASLEQIARIEDILRGDDTREEEIAAFHKTVLAARYQRK